MPLIQPDLSEAASFEPLTGTKRAKITEATPGISGTGNPKVVVKFGVEHEGKTITRTAHVPTTGKGAFKFEQLLRAAGFTDVANELQRDKRLANGFDTDDMVGCSMQLVFQIDPNDASRDEIKSFLKA